MTIKTIETTFCGSPKTYRVSESGTHYDKHTSDEVIHVLEGLIKSKTRVRIHYGFARPEEIKPSSFHKLGEDWLESSDTDGYIGRSTGIHKIPLIVNNKRSLGGPALLTESIVLIETTCKRRKVLYKHKAYNCPKLLLDYDADSRRHWQVKIEKFSSEPFASFSTPKAAKSFIGRFQHAEK